MILYLESLWAIHTRDYRVNDPLKCQILVTVPEILAVCAHLAPLLFADIIQDFTAFASPRPSLDPKIEIVRRLLS
jgi:hypothetical protein